MRSIFFVIIISFALIGFLFGQTQPTDDFILQAEKSHNAGNLDEAIKILETAAIENPQNALLKSQLGLYKGEKAGQTANYMEAGKLAGEAFSLQDEAVTLDPKNPQIRLQRGVLNVSVPEFLGRLNTGLNDLEFIIKLAEQSPDLVSKDILITAYDYLGRGYKISGDSEKAKHYWQKLVKIAPESTIAKSAQKNINEIAETEKPVIAEKQKPQPGNIVELEKKVAKDEKNPKLLLELGDAYFFARELDKAEKTLSKALVYDSTDVNIYKSYIQVVGALADKGYDQKIYEDTEYRTKLAFKVMNLAEKIVELAPQDYEALLLRSIIGVQMPFFVGKLEQGIIDLNKIIDSDAPASTKAEAYVWLGRAYQKKAISNWIKVVSKYPKTEAAKDAFGMMRPSVKHVDLSKYQAPFLSIDFVLGFQDELPPQSAVWIETKDGKFVKTVYVSGFSGYAKEKQVNLSEWADASEFGDADAVTSASIDLGHHIYMWDLKNSAGQKIKPGEYVVKIEVAYWPSLEYQTVSAQIKIDKDKNKVQVEEGNLIPYLEIQYFPKK